MNTQSLISRLTSLPVKEIRFFDEIGSTNDEALSWIMAGAPDGSLVAADTQSAGRGRFKRRWITRPGAALAFSLVLRPSEAERQYFGLFSPLGAVAVSRALQRCCSLDPQIKWPNDVLLNGRKVCGILVEAAWTGEDLQGVVIGIGVNVASSAINAQDQLLYPATTLEGELGQMVEREELLYWILKGIFELRSGIGSQAFLEEWESRLAFKNQLVRVEQEGDSPLEGILLGIDRDGSLRLETDAGDEQRVMVGDVHLRLAGT